MQHTRALLNTKDPEPPVMAASLRSCLHPTELVSRERCCSVPRQSYGASLRQAHANHSSTYHRVRAEPALSFLGCYSQTTLTMLCLSIYALWYSKCHINLSEMTAAHSYDISDTPNHGTNPSSYKEAARNCVQWVLGKSPRPA